MSEQQKKSKKRADHKKLKEIKSKARGVISQDFSFLLRLHGEGWSPQTPLDQPHQYWDSPGLGVLVPGAFGSICTPSVPIPILSAAQGHHNFHHSAQLSLIPPFSTSRSITKTPFGANFPNPHSPFPPGSWGVPTAK